jgi:ATP-dependent Clp endopeptidase proteolytic subunit ClpP
MPRSTITNQGNGKGEICLYDEIDAFFGVGAKQFNQQLQSLGDVKEIALRINSPGGSVWEGMAVLAMLNAHPARIVTRIEGLAASMASVIAMAGDSIEMPENAFMMIHNPADWAAGDAGEMRKTADVLDQVKESLVKIYAARTGRTAEEIAAWMDDETWMDGTTCKERGFATDVLPPVTIAANLKPNQFKKTPARLVAVEGAAQPPRTPKMPEATVETQTPKAATLKEIKAACPGADEKFICAQLEAEATAPQAAAAWMAALSAKNAELTAAAEANKAGAAKPGVNPPKAAKKSKKKDEDEDEMEDEAEDKPCDDMEDLDASEIKDRFEAAIAKVIKNRANTGRPIARRDAVMAVANKEPRLHQAWLAATNGTMQGKRLVAEKYDAMPKPRK